MFMKQLKLILRETPTDLTPTVKQARQRERFSQVAKQVAQEMKDTRLKGEVRVRAFNAEVSRRLRGEA
jgi:hypothetical protein